MMMNLVLVNRAMSEQCEGMQNSPSLTSVNLSTAQTIYPTVESAGVTCLKEQPEV